MIDQTETAVRIERTADVPAEALWAVLVDPARHPEIDGSGMLQAPVDAQPVTAVGQVFTMRMSHPVLGDYVSFNHVLELEPGRRIAWKTTREGRDYVGFQWEWEVEALSPGRSRITHVYDWSRVTDEAVLKRVRFPFVSAQEMSATVGRLIAVGA